MKRKIFRKKEKLLEEDGRAKEEGESRIRDLISLEQWRQQACLFLSLSKIRGDGIRKKRSRGEPLSYIAHES